VPDGPEPVSSIRVHCLTTGEVRDKRGERGVRRYLPGGWRDETLPVNAFLIEHPEGLCLFDTGQTARAARRGYLPAWHPFLRLARFELSQADEAGAQVRALGYDPGRLRWIVLSHLHTDHVGGIDSFAGTEPIVSRAEWERAIGLPGRLRGYLPQHLPHDLRPRLVELDGGAVGPFPGSQPLSADGGLVLVALPGHTPGHIGLLVRGHGRGFLLAGDLAHTRSELASERPDVADYCEREGIVPLLAHDRDAGGLAGASSKGAAPFLRQWRFASGS
jgi:glyoxylase-like metal-dependent hydrolase (beta-lactamase superfamily II)